MPGHDTFCIRDRKARRQHESNRQEVNRKQSLAFGYTVKEPLPPEENLTFDNGG